METIFGSNIQLYRSDYLFNKNEGLAIFRDEAGGGTIYKTVDGGEKWTSSPLKFDGYAQNCLYRPKHHVRNYHRT